MALTLTEHPARRAVPLTLAGAVAAAALAGCTGSVPTQLHFTDTEKKKITEVVIGAGSGDVAVKTAAVAETQIKRIVHYHGVEPASPTYRVIGTVLHVDTDCGNDCSVDYDIVTPVGVAVRGEVTSGDLHLTRVLTADVTVTSGDVRVSGATGEVKVEASSGNITVADLAGATRLVATSGDIEGRGLGGAPVTAEATSGNIDLQLARPGAVTAHASSGDVSVRVPNGRYQIRTDADSGEQQISIPNDPSSPHILDLSANSGDVTLTQR
jgi:hypothetical protein